MSVECMDRVFRYSKTTKPAERLVLLAIANHANADGSGAYPSIQTLAREAGGISDRYVKEIIRNLEEMGELTVATGGGNASNRYTVNVRPPKPEPVSDSTPVNQDAPVNPGSPVNQESPVGVNHSSPPHEPGFTPPMNQGSPDPSFNRPKPTVRARARAPTDRPTVPGKYADLRKLVNGRIPAGTGATPVEVFYEVWSTKEESLTNFKRDEMTRNATDLPRWRQAVKAWALKYKSSGNVEGMLDWYRDGIPKHTNGNRPSQEVDLNFLLRQGSDP